MIHKLLPSLTFTLLLILLIVNARSQTIAQVHPAMQNDDSIQINELAINFYNAFSFQNVDSGKLENLSKFFISKALFITYRGEDPVFVTINEFVDSAKREFKKEHIKTFEMNETCSRTEISGKIASRFSTYKVHAAIEQIEFNSAGIYTLQFIKQHNQWLITSAAWDKEIPNLKIPSKYICK